MDLSDNSVVTLSNYLTQTLSPDTNIRKPAEQILLTLESDQNFPVLLLKIVDSEAVDKTIRVSAAIKFKNYIKNNWKVDQDNADDKIHPQTREGIKSFIIDLMLKSSDSIQKQLSDAVSIIGKYDFPDNWKGLLEQMIVKFKTGHFPTINGALRTAHSLFKKYRFEFKSQKLWTEIKFVLDTFAVPLTELLEDIMKVAETQMEKSILTDIYNSLLFICKIFYSLNFQDLPEFFEDHMNTWMKHFHTLLRVNIPALITTDDEEPGILEQIRSQICENLIMYASKYDEEFTSFLPDFVEDIWNLLTSLGMQSKYDILVTNALTFLSTVADRNQYQYLFKNPAVLTGICEKVVFPNIEFRNSDQEMFEDNPDEYIRRDIEGSDVGTRRKAACDLIKVLVKFLEPQIKEMFLTYVQTMLQTYAMNKSNWKSKNAAIYLVTCLESRGQTQKHGVTQISNIINIGEFAVQHIAPELKKPEIDDLPVIKADCIRYVMTFRSVLPPQFILDVLAAVTNHFSSKSKVVHSYAAVCYERILLLKDPTSQISLVSPDNLVPAAKMIFIRLFAVLRETESRENEYVMKAILRTIAVLNDKSIPILEVVLTSLIEVLEVVAKNPSNPQFNHALFESMALCIKIVCSNIKSPEAVASFEAALFPIFQIILQQDVLEFLPYVFQLLSMLLEYRIKGEPIPTPYWELYQFLLSPILWERSGNIHPLVRLIAAYITRINPAEIDSKLQLMAVLGVFQQLVSSKANDHEGLYLLRVLIENCPNEILVPNIKKIFILLLQRLTQKKTEKYVKNLAVFLCFYVINYSPTDMITILNSLQDNLFGMVVEKILLSEAALHCKYIDKKILIVGLTKLITEVNEFISGPYDRFWPLILKQIIKALSSNEMITQLEEINPDDLDKGGYEVAYSKLVYASKPEYDPLQGIGDVVVYFAKNLSNLSKLHPNKLIGIIGTNLTTEEQQLLSGHLNAASVQL